MQQTGANEGVVGDGSTTALVTIDGVGSLLCAAVDAFEAAFRATVLKNTGRADAAGDATFRLDDAAGSWSGSGRIKSDKRPLPLHLASAAGSVRLVQSSIADGQGNTAPLNYLQFAAVFSEITFAHAPPDMNGEDAWTVEFTATKSGPLTQGWSNLDGAAEAALSTLPAFALKEILEGLGKTVDPNGITSRARQTFDLVGVANTDAAESTAVAAVLSAAATPMTHLKVRAANFVRTGTIGGRTVVDYGLQNSKDDAETPHNVATVDANNVRDYRTLAAVWDSGGGGPSAPAAPSGSKLVTYTDYKINDQKNLRAWVYARQDSKDDLETPRNIQTVDANDLRDSRTLAQAWASGGSAPSTPAAPSGLKLVTYTDLKINDAVNLRVWTYARQDSKDELEFARETIDAGGVDDTWERAQMYDSGGSPPASPTDSPPAGLVLAYWEDQKLNDAKGLRVFRYAHDNSSDRVINGSQRSSRSAVEAFTTTTVELLDTTSSPETVMNVYWPTFQALANAYRISTHKLHNGKAAIVREFLNPGIGLVSDLFATDKAQPGRVSGGNVQVYVVQKLSRGSSSYWLSMGRSQRRRSVRQFTISRLLSGTSVPDYPGLVETCNNATFLGLGAGLVMYLGAHLRTNIGLSGTFDFYLDYRFEWLSDGFFELVGWKDVLHVTASVSTGWVNLSTLTGSGMAATQPAQNDFSVFLA